MVVSVAVGAGTEVLTFANILRLAEGDRDPSLRQVAKASITSGCKDAIVVETVFTEDGEPLEQVAGAGDTLVDLGSARVMWFDTGTTDEWFVASFPAGPANVFHLVSTVYSTDKRMKRWVTRLGSRRGIMRAYLNHAAFVRIGASLADRGDVAVSRMTSVALRDGSTDARTWKSRIEQPSPGDVIDAAEGAGYAVKTLNVAVPGVVSVFLRRLAGATFYNGDWEAFHVAVLDELAAAAAARRAVIVVPPRQPRAEARPVSLTLPEPLLATPAETALVLREVAGLTNVTMAVLHRNPYLHFVVTDEDDGSNFDVFVTEANVIDVYPGFWATPAALSRVTNALCARFGVDQVGGRPEREWSIEELTGA